jgi:hypothetical protein
VKLPPGYASDHVDLVEQADLAARLGDNFDAAQRFENSVREGSSARPAAREGKDDEVLLIATMPLPLELLQIPVLYFAIGD